MKIREMFKKSIDRPIKGVIKVAQNDDETIDNELDEYVVTRELVKHFSHFYGNYQKGIDGFTDEMGVWISGFFGSGKSHFLKILSYILNNNKINGKKPVEYFKDKLQDSYLYADMQRSAQNKTETILFNIDSKSPMGIKTDKDAILKVFIKVFNEHRGFYGDDFKVAELEKFLEKESSYDAFKVEFSRIMGEEWLDRRNCFAFDGDAIIEALVKTSRMSETTAREWFNSSKTVDTSIEKFAREVKEYVEGKDKNFHLIFLVDEIGQYIGSNTDLMLNLQTVAEDLGTYCKGKVWVIVTSQEDIDSVTKVKGNDFSKIQGRFKTRLSLSASSVDEVIKKRILEKQAYAIDKLSLIYSEQGTTLKNLIHFSDSVSDLKGFSGEQDFIEYYPFVPYQTRLLQNVFEKIRRHGATGKHLSEGERSMLSAFQEAAKKVSDFEAGVIVPFYTFYQSINEFLDGSIRRVITRADESANNGDGLNAEDVDVLKLLFLIRYIEDIPSNLENIATLMISSASEDKAALKERIRRSLERLIRENYIQKNADQYKFLTDDEQDINRDIRNTEVDSSKVADEIGGFIFNSIYEDNKCKYNNRYNFAFNKKIDESTVGIQNSKIGLRFLTQASDIYDSNEASIIMASSVNQDLIIRLEENSEYFEEIQEAMKIEKYVKQKNHGASADNIKIIITAKQGEASNRRKRAKELLEEAIMKGLFYVAGEKVDVKGSGAKERINSGLKMLVDSVYTKLNYIKEFIESDSDIVTILRANSRQLTIEGDEKEENPLAMEEIFSYIDMQDSRHLQITMKNIHDRFTDAPFGWNRIDIAGLVANTLKNQKIRLQYQGAILEIADKNIPDYLLKTTEVEKLIIKKRIGIDPALLKAAKDALKEVFSTVNVPDDEDGLVHLILDKVREKEDEVRDKYLSQYEGGKKYPGRSLVDKGIKIFRELESCKKDNNTLLSKLKSYKEELLDWDEDMKLIQGFFANQRSIFDKGQEMVLLISDNKHYLKGEEFVQKAEQLESIIKDPVPYKKIQLIPDLTLWLETDFKKILNEKKKVTKAAIAQDEEYLAAELKRYDLIQNDIDRFKAKIEKWYEEKYRYVDESSGFERLDASITQSSNFKTALTEEIEVAIEKNKPVQDGAGEVKESLPPYVLNIKDFAIVGQLETEEDVDAYVGKLSLKLKNIIKSKKKIKFI